MQFRGGVLLLTLLLIVGINVSNKPETIVKEISKEQIRKEFAIYKQNTEKTKYEEVEENTFPDKGYLLNEILTKCYGYNKEEITPIPVTQELTKGSIDGRVTIESSKTIYCELYFDLDNKEPEVNEFSITGKTSNGDTLNNGFTYQTDNIPYTLTYDDKDVTQYCISNTSECTEWKEIKEKIDTLTIDASDGEKTMYIYLKDKANNVSVTTTKSTAKIIVDRTKPVVKTFALTGAADEGQQLSDSKQYTHTKNITYNATIEESNIDSYCIYEDSCNYQTTSSTTLTNKEYSLNDIEGSHSVKIRVKDKAGNESDINTTSTQSIKLDKTNPTATISPSTQDTSSITVTVGYQEPDSIIKRQCKLDSESTWTDAKEDGGCTISNLSDGKEYTIQARVRDASGRWNTDYPNVTVTTEKVGFSGTGEQLISYNPAGLVTTDPQGMKRFSGFCVSDASQGIQNCAGIVDNFVCFGYDHKSQCGDSGWYGYYDEMFRIIGITADGGLKLIKYFPLMTEYMWEESWKFGSWQESTLYKAINGIGFYDSLGAEWQKIITASSWPGDFVADASLPASELLRVEWGTVSPERAHIGLQAPSDVVYACGDDGSDCSGNLNGYWGTWLTIPTVEWTMTGSPLPDHEFMAWYAGDLEPLEEYPRNVELYVRPVFYLDQDALIVSGSGTWLDPFIISPCLKGDVCDTGSTESGGSEVPLG